MVSRPGNSGFNPGRREFGRMAVTGTVGAAAFLGSSQKAPAQPDKPGIKLCAQFPADPSDEQLLFLKQIGAEYVSVGSTRSLRTAEGFLRINQRYAHAGSTVWNSGTTDLRNMPEGTLNLPGRDQKIDQYRQYLRNLGKAGIRYTTYAHMGNGIWSSGRTEVRGASAREFDLSSPKKQG